MPGRISVAQSYRQYGDRSMALTLSVGDSNEELL